MGSLSLRMPALVVLGVLCLLGNFVFGLKSLPCHNCETCGTFLADDFTSLVRINQEMAAGTKAAVQLFQLATSSSLSSSSSSSPSQASLNDEAAKRSHQSMEESLFASVMRMQKLGELVRQRQETAAHIIEVCTHLLALLPSPIYSEETVGTSYNVRPPFHEDVDMRSDKTEGTQPQRSKREQQRHMEAEETEKPQSPEKAAPFVQSQEIFHTHQRRKQLQDAYNYLGALEGEDTGDLATKSEEEEQSEERPDLSQNEDGDNWEGENFKWDDYHAEEEDDDEDDEDDEEEEHEEDDEDDEDDYEDDENVQHEDDEDDYEDDEDVEHEDDEDDDDDDDEEEDDHDPEEQEKWQSFSDYLQAYHSIIREAHVLLHSDQLAPELKLLDRAITRLQVYCEQDLSEQAEVESSTSVDSNSGKRRTFFSKTDSKSSPVKYISIQNAAASGLESRKLAEIIAEALFDALQGESIEVDVTTVEQNELDQLLSGNKELSELVHRTFLQSKHRASAKKSDKQKDPRHNSESNDDSKRSN